MKVLKAYKFRLYPNSIQKDKMSYFSGACRFVWNVLLAENIEKYKAGDRKRVGYSTMCKSLTKMKSEEGSIFLRNVHSQVLQQAIKDLNQAYDNFFLKRSGFPKFKKKTKNNSFRFPQGFKIKENFIYLPKIGWVKFKKSREILGGMRNATVSLAAGEWYVSILTETDTPEKLCRTGTAIGIDLGVRTFAVLSDRTEIKFPETLPVLYKKIGRLNRRKSKQINGSNNQEKTKLKIQKLYHKISCIRLDFLHKASTTICKNHAKVVIEDLGVREMTSKNRRIKRWLRKAILDQGWREFRKQLAYKTVWLSGELKVVSPKFTSQKCSICGTVSPKNRLHQEFFRCISCGHEDNADCNAAINILAAGLAV